MPLTVVVFGASGDLAYKKTFPALYALSLTNCHIIGYARSKFDVEEWKTKVTSHIKFPDDHQLDQFKRSLYYVSGQYDSSQDFERLANLINDLEASNPGNSQCNRLFYLAIPPSQFASVAATLKRSSCYTTKGWNRLIIEKPFGHDLDSSNALSLALDKSGWKEHEMYRIDHYLGKEMVKNLLILRFANTVLQKVWNRDCIELIQITFKEPFGTEGRGGYFDEIGIIRDVMQNHLLQILTLVAMEKPKSLEPEAIRDAKVQVLKCIEPIRDDDVLLGQYLAANGKPGYKDDKTVPPDSLTATFAAATMWINNSRWQRVPFLLKCGKALDDGKVDIRIQFKPDVQPLFPGLPRNELVIRVQPKEAMYLKTMLKHPGHGFEPVMSELDLTYHSRYPEARIPDAYEALILDCINGDGSNFVRSDELQIAWEIFTPLLHKIEKEKWKPLPYDYGSRGPKGLTEFVQKYGFERGHYEWPISKKSTGIVKAKL